MQAVIEGNPAQAARQQAATQRQIRGSSLFLVGRFLALSINFAAQVLMVRYLSMSDYGGLAYALAIVAFIEPFATLGLQETVARFLPIYHENRENEKLFGTILLSTGAVFLTGLVISIVVWGAPGLASHITAHQKLPLHLLTILIFLVPVDAIDELMNGLFASFSGVRDIFFRKYLLGPALKLGAVLLLIWQRSSVTFLAYGYLLASALGVLIYSWMLIRLLHDQHLLGELRPRAIKVPVRELFAFVLPSLSASLVTVAIHSVNIFLLGYLRTMTDVAYYRAVVPVAQLNNVVMSSFALLYTPSAARLLAKADYAGINKLYWQTAAWMSVLSFPIFAVTFSLAQPLSTFLYGQRYEASGPILALLSLGSYFNVLLGFNLQTLKVLERLRYIVVASVLAALANVAVNLLLIPRHGAVGAAIGTAGTLIVYNLLMQIGLLPTSHFHVFDRRYVPVYLTIGLGAAGLFALQSLASVSFYLALVLAGCVSLIVFAVTKKRLGIADTFPELLRLPLMRFIFAEEIHVT
ncbi:MAG TPA: flippase [Terriglobia bacterium]|nr:flippase [Terriglobia bacterium]